jgi:membrane AbrB-like protein
MIWKRVRAAIPTILIHLAAVLAGALAWWLHVPLPWMIGPMVFAAIVNFTPFAVPAPKFTRPVGQTVVAAVVGMAFTPTALEALLDHFVLMLAVSAATIVAGLAAGVVLMRLTRIDAVTAALSGIPGGPAEMAAFAVRHGAVPGTVALVQTVRIFVLVLTLPPLLVAVEGATGATVTPFTPGGNDVGGAALLMGIAVTGSVVFYFMRLTSPFFLGALAFSATASAISLPVAMPPTWMLAGAQVFLGVWLGTTFDRALFTKGRSFMVAALASTVALMALSAVLAVAAAAFAGIDWRTMVLSTAPGGTTEMALTARILHQDVATVTAFHVVRIFVTLAVAPMFFSYGARMTRNGRPPDDRP